MSAVTDIASGDDIFLLHARQAWGRGDKVCGWWCGGGGDSSGLSRLQALLQQRARWASEELCIQGHCDPHPRRSTAACNAAVAAAVITGIFSSSLMLPATLYATRLIPDYLIAYRNIKKREGLYAPPLFILSELIYPLLLHPGRPHYHVSVITEIQLPRIVLRSCTDT
ncbi:MAG: hypothetical protein MZV63_24610 [Marinilabiliales bacterium]|nr:hypothetical protein [Marinilabiliales bacterium]